MKEEFEKYHSYLNDQKGEDDLNDDILSFLDNTREAKLPSFKRSKEEIWKALDASIEEDEADQPRVVPFRRFYAIAAAVALIIAATFTIRTFNTAEQIQVSSVVGESKLVHLPDGSKVTLNANSKLSYSSDWDRKLELEGEAFFEVTKGGKFKVNTPNGIVQVLGTSFNVFSRAELFRVACRTGKVSVEIPSGNFKGKLTKGQTIEKDLDTVKRKLIDPAIIGTWKVGEFRFENAPILEVFDELQRQYNIEIDAKSTENRSFSGYFTNTDLDLALTSICEPLELSYEIKDNLVTIRTK